MIRKLYKILWSENSLNWPKFLPIATGLVNARPLKRIGNLSPGSINSLADDIAVRQSQKDAQVQVAKEANYKQQNLAQKKYEKSGKFKIGDYVYLDYKESTFAKSFDLKVSK
jgi:hypothetical protein